MKSNSQYKMLLITICLLLLGLTASQEFLQNVPITFALTGITSYVPSTGGVSIQGYQLTAGFSRYSWLGVMFMTLTSTSNYDTLIFNRATTSGSGVYSVTVSDYYVSPGRPNTLMIDTMTSNDQTTTSTTDSSTFTLTFPRTTSSTNGQDWQGGQFVNVCFFTSDSVFSQSTWSKQYEVCYGYQVNNYVSTYRGSYLGAMDFEGVSSQVYGGIYGPYLQMKLFWFRNSAIIGNSSNMIIRAGNQINADLGYDFYICGDGDYYGKSTSTLYKDLIYSGYDNGACTFTINSNSVTMSYTRDIFTFDSFDASLSQSLHICLYGSSESCGNLNIPLNIPSMTVSSALTIWQYQITVTNVLALMMLFTLTLL